MIDIVGPLFVTINVRTVNKLFLTTAEPKLRFNDQPVYMLGWRISFSIIFDEDQINDQRHFIFLTFEWFPLNAASQ